MKTLAQMTFAGMLFVICMASLTSCKKHPSKTDSVIRIEGVNEPPELLIPTEAPLAKTDDVQAFVKALEGIHGGNEVQALPSLDAFIQKYPYFGDAYPLRASIRCLTNDLVGAKADAEHALANPQRVLATHSDGDRSEMTAMHAKLAFLAHDSATTSRDIDVLIASYSTSLQYLTDGRVKLHDKPSSACSWTPEDVERWSAESGRAPNAQVFQTMYTSSFAPLDDHAKVIAAQQGDNLVRTQPQSAAAYFYAAVAAEKIAAFKSLAFNEAERTAYDQRLIELFSHALALDPNLQQAYAQRADEHLQEKEYTLAIPDYDHAIALHPTDAGLWNDRGLAKQETYDKDGAIADFSKAIELKTTNEDFNAMTYSLENRAEQYTKLTDYKKALADYNTLIGLRLHDVMMSINLDFFRQLYPEYAQVDDARLKDKLHKMYYPNFSNEVFDQTITKPAGAHPTLSAFLPEAYLKRADTLLALKQFSAAQDDLRRATRFPEQHAQARWRTPPGLENSRVDLQTLEVQNPAAIKVWARPGTDDSAPTDDSPSQFVVNCHERTVQTLPNGAPAEPTPGSYAEQLRDFFCTAR